MPVTLSLPARVESYVAAARWLGPWADPHERPLGVERRAWRGRDGQVAWVYRGRRATRRVFVVPGVHYDGPTDPRLDRLCRVFAATGAVVAVPFVAPYMRLEVSPTAIGCVRSVWSGLGDAAIYAASGPTTLFSISFGCLPALRLASDPEFAVAFEEVVTFGGYSDFGAAFRFALTGQSETDPGHAYDPLNRPVAFCSLLDQMDVRVFDAAGLRRAWVRYARRTWGRPEMKRGNRHLEEAAAVASTVDVRDRDLFLTGCGARDGGVELCMDALGRTEVSFTDPLARGEGLRARLLAVHGRSDDVVPSGQSLALAERAGRYTRSEAVLTGAYGHTGSSGMSLGAMTSELRGLARVLGRLSGA